MSLKLSFRIISMRAEEGYAQITIQESWGPPGPGDAKKATAAQGPPTTIDVPVDPELMAQLRVGQYFSLEPGPLSGIEAKPVVDGRTFVAALGQNFNMQNPKP